MGKYNFRAQCCQKYGLYEKNASNKNCCELNFPEKTHCVPASIFPRSGIEIFKIL